MCIFLTLYLDSIYKCNSMHLCTLNVTISCSCYNILPYVVALGQIFNSCPTNVLDFSLFVECRERLIGFCKTCDQRTTWSFQNNSYFMTRFHNLAYDSSDNNICTINVIVINDMVNKFLVIMTKDIGYTKCKVLHIMRKFSIL